MFGVIVHHYALPGKQTEGVNLIRANGRLMQKIKGFRARHTLIARDNNRKISTVTFWDSEEAYKNWMQSDVRKSIPRPPELWTEKPEPEFFDELPELG
jgi:heme-degrading monooxygenase HmoA